MTDDKQKRVHRAVSSAHIIQYLVYHHSRMVWMRKQKKPKEADLHEADFQKAFVDATPKEKATYEFLIAQMGAPNFPQAKEYEAYPLTIHSLRAPSRWFKEAREPRTTVSIQLPVWMVEEIKEKTKNMMNVDRSDLFRDAIAKEFGFPIPKAKTNSLQR